MPCRDTELKESQMAFALQTTGVFAIALKLTIASQLFYPCEVGVATKAKHDVTSCNHKVPLDKIKTGINSTIKDLNKIIENIENQLNLVNNTTFNKNLTRISSPPLKANKKISFLHETYANFTQVQNLINTFPFNERNITLQPVMCLIYQVNRKLQCKKIKKRKKWTDFRKSRACYRDNLERDISKPKELRLMNQPKELRLMNQAKYAAAILVETLEFWENCVVEKKNRRLKVIKKCKKAKKYIKRGKQKPKLRRRKNRKHKNIKNKRRTNM